MIGGFVCGGRVGVPGATGLLVGSFVVGAGVGNSLYKNLLAYSKSPYVMKSKERR